MQCNGPFFCFAHTTVRVSQTDMVVRSTEPDFFDQQRTMQVLLDVETQTAEIRTKASTKGKQHERYNSGRSKKHGQVRIEQERQ